MQLTLSDSRKEIINTLLLGIGYGLFIYSFQFFLFKIGSVSHIPNVSTLNRWDAPIYLDIARNGYTQPIGHFNNAGWYVLFPWNGDYSIWVYGASA